MLKTDNLVALGMIAFSALLYFQTLDFADGADKIPRLMILIIAVAGVIVFVRSILGLTPEKQDNRQLFANWGKWFMIMGMWLFYILLISRTGFYSLTALFIFVLTWFLQGGGRSWSALFKPSLFAAGFVAALYLAFRILLKVDLPQGAIF